jgi:hypothetical protein
MEDYCEWVATELNIEIPEDWEIKAERVLTLQSSHSPLNKYGFSILTMLKDLYPEYSWHTKPKIESWRME